jgi:putative transposon-encoded protein
MVRRMIATITQIESVVTPSGNSGHVVVPKAWIGKEAIVVLKENRPKGKKVNSQQKKPRALIVMYNISRKLTIFCRLIPLFCI